MKNDSILTFVISEIKENKKLYLFLFPLKFILFISILIWSIKLADNFLWFIISLISLSLIINLVRYFFTGIIAMLLNKALDWIISTTMEEEFEKEIYEYSERKELYTKLKSNDMLFDFYNFKLAHIIVCLGFSCFIFSQVL